MLEFMSKEGIRIRGAKKKEEEELRKALKKKEPETEEEAPDDCPEGYEFGIDFDEKEECEACEVWNECGDYKDKLDKEEG